MKIDKCPRDIFVLLSKSLDLNAQMKDLTYCLRHRSRGIVIGFTNYISGDWNPNSGHAVFGYGVQRDKYDKYKYGPKIMIYVADPAFSRGKRRVNKIDYENLSRMLPTGIMWDKGISKTN